MSASPSSPKSSVLPSVYTHTQYLSIINKTHLKLKKKFLRKPNIPEAAKDFESIGNESVKIGSLRRASSSYREAGRCHELAQQWYKAVECYETAGSLLFQSVITEEKILFDGSCHTVPVLSSPIQHSLHHPPSVSNSCAASDDEETIIDAIQCYCLASDINKNILFNVKKSGDYLREIGVRIMQEMSHAVDSTDWMEDAAAFLISAAHIYSGGNELPIRMDDIKFMNYNYSKATTSNNNSNLATSPINDIVKDKNYATSTVHHPPSIIHSIGSSYNDGTPNLTVHQIDYLLALSCLDLAVTCHIYRSDFDNVIVILKMMVTIIKKVIKSGSLMIFPSVTACWLNNSNSNSNNNSNSNINSNNNSNSSSSHKTDSTNNYIETLDFNNSTIKSKIYTSDDIDFENEESSLFNAAVRSQIRAERAIFTYANGPSGKHSDQRQNSNVKDNKRPTASSSSRPSSTDSRHSLTLFNPYLSSTLLHTALPILMLSETFMSLFLCFLIRRRYIEAIGIYNDLWTIMHAIAGDEGLNDDYDMNGTIQTLNDMSMDRESSYSDSVSTAIPTSVPTTTPASVTPSVAPSPPGNGIPQDTTTTPTSHPPSRPSHPTRPTVTQLLSQIKTIENSEAMDLGCLSYLYTILTNTITYSVDTERCTHVLTEVAASLGPYLTPRQFSVFYKALCMEMKRECTNITHNGLDVSLRNHE